MAELVYFLCALASLVCAGLLLRKYTKTRVRLLFWSSAFFRSVGFFAFVIIFSIAGRSSFAFASVVVMLSLATSEDARPFMSAARRFLERPNVRLALWCRMDKS